LRAPGEKRITTTSLLGATWKGTNSKLVPRVEIEQKVLDSDQKQELEKEMSRRRAMTGRGCHLVEVERNQEAATVDQPVTAHRLKQWDDGAAFPIQLE
jgi:hypothetical protein